MVNEQQGGRTLEQSGKAGVQKMKPESSCGEGCLDDFISEVPNSWFPLRLRPCCHGITIQNTFLTVGYDNYIWNNTEFQPCKPLQLL